MRQYLADTSAVVRLIKSTAHADWTDAAMAGRIAICPPVEVELAVTARNWRDYQDLQTYLRATFTWLPVPDSAWLVVAAAQTELVKIGHHRGPSMADLLVAATALENDHSVLHLDFDFESIQKALPVTLTRVDQPAP